jgi:Fe2+ transport system protein FeoA
MLENGKRGVVARVLGGRGVRDHLLRLGMIPGVPVRKLQGGGQGPVVVEVLGTSVMLGMGMAEAVELR